MKERPILFGPSMVESILANWKTQTRRVVKPNPDILGHFKEWTANRTDQWIRMCRCDQPGDRLWVKETWQPEAYWGTEDVGIKYAADNDYRVVPRAQIPDTWAYPKASTHGNVTPLFMPRWASRITLEIIEVRVQRLQEISPSDAKCEGDHERSGMPEFYRRGELCHIDWFHQLWDSINSKRGFGWEVNPWVWALTFRLIEVKK